MMDLQRNLLIIALLLVSFMLWEAWKQDVNYQHQSKQYETQVATTTENYTNNHIPYDNQEKRIMVKTDVLELIINTSRGIIEQAFLLNYPKTLKSKEPFQLLETTSEFIYQAQSGIVNHADLNNLSNNNKYQFYNLVEDNKNVFELASDQNKLIIPTKLIDAAGNIFTRTFILKRGEYVVDIDYSIYNSKTEPLTISVFGKIQQSIKLPSYRNANNNFALNTFRGTAFSTQNKKYKKYNFDTIINNDNFNVTTRGGWVAMLQQYFATAWIPNNNSINNFYALKINDNNTIVIGYQSQAVLIHPNKIKQLHNTLWIGPEIQDKMAAIAPNLDLIVDYGWLWFISQPLFNLLKFIYNFLGNWGFSIIAITFIVRGIMYPLTKAQYTSMAKMYKLQPKIQNIRKRLSHDKQRQSQEIIALYKSEKVNPLGGCFPLLIQMPIFLGLYYMLMSSVELRHAPFVLWIHDLSSQDPYYILPIFMGITMFFIQNMSPTTMTADQIQKKIMLCIPITFTIFFLWFPSGLVLYYTISNLMTIIQQKLIYRNLRKCGMYKFTK